MRLRWKLLILLLILALLPTIVMTVFANQLTFRRGRAIGHQAQTALTERMERELDLLVSSQASQLGQMGLIIELLLQVQAREVEACLAAPVPTGQPVYSSEDFDAPHPELELTRTQRYVRLNDDGEALELPISTVHQVFTFPDGVQQVEVMDDMLRLSRMSTVYRSLKQIVPDALYWQYTSLENGLHGCYPGHGGYARDYDPRQRTWYKQIKEGGVSTWTAPYTEISTRRPVLTARMPVHRPDGSFAGVTAIDVAVSELIKQYSPEEMGHAQIKMVVPVPRDGFVPGRSTPTEIQFMEPDQLTLYVLAEDGDDTEENEAGFKVQMLGSEDAETYQAMIRDMQRGLSGVRHMPYQDRPSIWAYASSEQYRTFLLAIVSEEHVLAEARRAEQTVLSQVRSQLQLTLTVLGAVILLVILVTFAGSRSVTEPVSRLAAAARKVAGGDLEDTHVEIQSRDEIGELGRAFNEMIPQLQDRLQMRHALALAMEVQQHLLPNESPKLAGLDIFGRSFYCDETGGDYFDFVHLLEYSPHEVGVAVGDVTGHGVAAALMMTGARALLRSRAAEPGSISRLLEVMNRHLTEDAPLGKFMTLFYLKIDTTQRTLHWGSAGHDPAITYRPDTDAFGELTGSGIPLGIDADWKYKESRRDGLAEGEVIVIGTDGIWESRDAADEMYGKDRLRDVIRKHASASSERIGTAIHEDVLAFRGACPQEDDVTFVVVRVCAS